MPLLSSVFQIDLRKFCSGWDAPKLQQIDDMFQAAGVVLGPEDAGTTGGERQRKAQRYLSTVNWDSEDDAEKVLRAVSIALADADITPEQKEKLRALCQKEKLKIEGDEVSLGSLPGRKQPAQKRKVTVADFEIFVSWSRPSSRQAAEAFKDWLPEALPGVKPWMSSEDITKGTSWFKAISDQLSRSRACLICITPENVNSSWLYYEAGATAHAIPEALICPYLIEVKPSALSGTPLGSYQVTIFDKEDTWRLVRSLHSKLDTAHDEGLLRKAFDRSWPSLQKKLAKVVTLVTTPDPPDKPDAPDLSDEAKRVLMETSKDDRGVLSMTKTMRGFDLTTHGLQLVDGNDARLEAAYREAVNDLVSRKLLEPRGDTGESFALTKSGWTLGDKLTGKVS
jgi:hypothetical protein